MWTKKEVSNFIDLTSLNSFDSTASIQKFLETAIGYHEKGFSVAAVCLYPNFAALAVDKLQGTGIKTAVVAGNFPSSQGYISTKLKECELVLEAGVDEVDIVLNLGEFDSGNYTCVVDEIRAFKGLMGNKELKVILETGYLKTPERIRKASELAIEGGADFIKTSTGKEFQGASVEAVEVMIQVINEQEESQRVGLKISGGVRTFEDALKYMDLIEKNLGVQYLVPDKFRIGASSLMKDLINA